LSAVPPKSQKTEKGRICKAGDIIGFPPGCEHEIFNCAEEELVFVETATGEIAHGKDTVASKEASGSSHLQTEPLVKMSPAFKDYLWGGTLLRDKFHMQCDYEIIAEAWVLSAHAAGQSILASGQYKGMHFGDYIQGIGKEALG